VNKFLVSILLLFFISGSFITVFSSVSASSVLVADSWNTKASMSQTRSGFGVVVVDGKIYAIGGYGNGVAEVVGVNECYDPVSDVWVTLASMPTPRADFAIVAFSGKIYCIGGEVPYFGPVFVSQTVDIVEVYDPVNDTWSNKTSFPIKVSRPITCVINNQLFVITFDGKTYMYDQSSDNWSNKASISVYSGDITVRVINDQIFAIFYSETEWTLCMYNQTTDSWIKKAEPSILHGVFEFIVMDNKIMICDHPMHVNDFSLSFRIYDPVMDSWSEGQTVNKLASYAVLFVGITSGVYAPKNVYVFGWEQINAGDTVQTFTWVYDHVCDVWLTAKSAPIANIFNGIKCIVTIDDVMYVIGESGTVKQYVPVGYDPLGYLAPPVVSNGITSPVLTESEAHGTFLTVFVVVTAAVLTICAIVMMLLFYLKERKKNKRSRYE